MSAVLITVQNGTVDYVTDGEGQVVIVDFDSFDPDTSFPEDVDVVMEQVLSLPQSVPWRGGIVKRLQEIRRECRKALHASTVDRPGPPDCCCSTNPGECPVHEPEPPCCDYRDHAGEFCTCPDHERSELHPFGHTEDLTPANCPTCGALWGVKSKTMGAAAGQPHQWQCLNGHWWTQGAKGGET